MKRASIVCLLALALLGQQSLAQVGAGTSEALGYLKARQNPDGGFSEPGASSDLRTTCWVLLAGAAAGEQPLTWASSGSDPARFLESSAGSAGTLLDIELAANAIAAAGGNPRSVAGRDLIALIEASASPEGRIGAGVAEHCWGVLAIAAVGDTIPAANTEWLIGQQRTDGGWGESDGVIVECTALAVEALVATEEEGAEQITGALDLLRGRINPDGGFSGATSGSDVQATSRVIRAINASGEDPASEDWEFEGNTPISYLESMQAGDGHFKFSNGVESQPAMTSAMAVPALEGEYLPILSSLEADTLDEGLPGTTAEDLGTAGAGMTASDDTEGTLEGLGGRGAYRQASGAAARGGGPAGFWVFVIICGIYAVLLLVVAAVIRLAPKRPAGGRAARAP